MVTGVCSAGCGVAACDVCQEVVELVSIFLMEKINCPLCVMSLPGWLLGEQLPAAGWQSEMAALHSWASFVAVTRACGTPRDGEALGDSTVELSQPGES